MPIRVLVAEDHPLVREAVSRALSQDPSLAVVGEAGTGEEAIELAAELRPDILILDLVMPGVGGLAVLDRLRETQPEIRIVVLTANENASTVLDAIAAGAAGYLSKSAVGEELRQAVIAAHGGASAITPSLASDLLKELTR
jgi:DNA-binding NarL/FixJ family response regulator